MNLTINGQSESIDERTTVADVLRRFSLAPVRVAVEVNRELVPRSEYANTTLKEGDSVEIVTFVGGG